jgi:hypothetical protein
MNKLNEYPPFPVTKEEEYIDQHWNDFLDGRNNSCDCGLCQDWRIEEGYDLENV